MKLSNAQVYTLRRMKSGTKYMLRGDGKKGYERRPACRTAMDYDPINSASLPVLHRLGLVEFTIDRGQEPTKFYNVQLSKRGRECVETAQPSEDANG
ncbi:hypothetical protein NLN92_18940 [Citrobacter portucalensis]|uniref:hypothetical protein n=1 Tax=Citrobacter portucalensis TaxID=1639133 RepID=UPI00226B6E4D|nr:hypothetical protein [Citrobacter portucalensis]MCX8980083.1 hypothetical protein [Citrobacter portucalensis]